MTFHLSLQKRRVKKNIKTETEQERKKNQWGEIFLIEEKEIKVKLELVIVFLGDIFVAFDAILIRKLHGLGS